MQKPFYQYLWSAILTSLSGILCVQIDGIIVSHLLGSNAFAAIGVLMPLMQIQLTLCLLIGVGGAMQLAYEKGANNSHKANQFFTTTIGLLLLCSLPFVVMAGWSEQVASCFCHTPDLMPLATSYGRVLLLSAPIYLLLQGSGALVRAEGFPKRILWAMVLANVLNLSMDILFIHCFGWGIAGAGWATTISNAIALVIILTRPNDWHLAWPQTISHNIGRIVVAGTPVALGSVAMFIRLSYLTSSTTHHLGEEGMVILSMLLSVFLIVNLLAGGTTQALQPLAKQYMGEANSTALYCTCRHSLRFTLISSIAVTLLVVWVAQPLCLLYGVDTSHGQPAYALRIFALSYAFYSLGYVFMVIHQVLGHQLRAVLIAILQPLIVIPIYALLIHTPWIWWAFPCAELLSLIIIILLSQNELRTIYTTTPCC